MGIARWRFLEEFVQRSVAATDQGLSRLVAQGYLREEDVPGQGRVFRLNPDKRVEAERYLNASRPGKGQP